MKKAFTLAEILISMAIIGVIATLMVPVMTNSQKKSLETATAHFYSMMAQAVKQYMVDNDTESLATTPIVENWAIRHDGISPRPEAVKAVDDFVNKYFNVRKTCNKENQYECFPETITSINEQTGQYELLEGDGTIYVLSNGAVFAMRPITIYYRGDARGAEVQFDVNGKKGPNIAGRDIWFFTIFMDGTITDKKPSNWIGIGWKQYEKEHPDEYKNEIDEMFENRSRGCLGENTNGWFSTYGGGCFGKFENNDFKFDY